MTVYGIRNFGDRAAAIPPRVGTYPQAGVQKSSMAPPAHRPTKLAMPRHENVQQSKAQLAKQARSKAIHFSSESEGATIALQKAHDDEGVDDETNVDLDGDEEDIDAPRVAQWIDDGDLEPQEQTDDASDSEEASDHSTSEVGPSRTLVRASCVIRLHPSTDSHTFR